MAAWMIPAAIIASSLLGSRSASKAASTQAAAAERGAELERQTAQEQLALQKRIYEEGVARQQPWLTAGEEALNKLLPLSTQYTPFGQKQFFEDPGYTFRLAEGQKALERQAAARGGLISGAALKAAQRYGQEMGSQEFMNAFNRYQAERAAQLQPLQSLAGVGQTTAQQLGAAGQQYAGMAGQTALGSAASQAQAQAAAAQARASGYMGGAQAIASGLGQYMNYQQQQAQNTLLQQALANKTAPVINYLAPSSTGTNPYEQFLTGGSA